MLEAVEAAAEVFVAHTTNKDNPHKVTKEQVGLDNVDNTSDMDKPVSKATASAIETLKQETLSAINTFKKENSAEHIDIYSAIKTAKTDSLEELEKAVTAINESIDSFYSQLNNTIHSLEESNSAAHTALVSSINNAKSELQTKIDTTNRTINTVQANLQTEINNKAASSHNHDSTYSKINHTHTGYAASSHNHSLTSLTGTLPVTSGGTGLTHGALGKASIAQKLEPSQPNGTNYKSGDVIYRYSLALSGVKLYVPAGGTWLVQSIVFSGDGKQAFVEYGNTYICSGGSQLDTNPDVNFIHILTKIS